MGSVISASAAREDIVKDVGATLEAATARGGDVATEAEQQLAPTLALYREQEVEAKAAEARAVSARAQRAVANEKADDVVVAVADDLFEAGGRRRNDPFLALVLPGGATPITRAGLESQPAVMRAVAKLLSKARHPRIPKPTYESAAQRLSEAADALGTVIDATRTQISEADLADQIMTSLAALVRADLMAFKRSLLGKGWSETEVHALIPDRPRAEPEKKDA